MRRKYIDMFDRKLTAIISAVAVLGAVAGAILMSVLMLPDPILAQPGAVTGIVILEVLLLIFAMRTSVHSAPKKRPLPPSPPPRLPPSPPRLPPDEFSPAGLPKGPRRPSPLVAHAVARDNRFH
jgi:hypothetical protein